MPAPTPAVGFEPAYGPGDGPVARRGGSSQHATPRRPRRRRRILSTLLIVLGVALTAAAGGMWAYAQLQYRAQDETNAKLATFATVSDDPAAPEAPQVDWAALKAVNPDVVGWVQIPGTVVNYPVYQGKDNEQYLHTTAEGDYAIGGQVFLDYENAKPGLQDPQTMIYGHHLWNGTMFTEVDAMTDQTEFDKHPVVWYATEEATYELEPLFTYKAAATNAEARRISFASGDELHSYLRGASRAGELQERRRRRRRDLGEQGGHACHLRLRERLWQGRRSRASRLRAAGRGSPRRLDHGLVT